MSNRLPVGHGDGLRRNNNIHKMGCDALGKLIYSVKRRQLNDIPLWMQSSPRKFRGRQPKDNKSGRLHLRL